MESEPDQAWLGSPPFRLRYVPPDLVDGFLSRLGSFVRPFAAGLASEDQRRHTLDYLTGLLSRLERKTSEGIAYLLDRERQGLQKFIGLSPWDHAPLLRTLARQVGEDLLYFCQIDVPNVIRHPTR